MHNPGLNKENLSTDDASRSAINVNIRSGEALDIGGSMYPFIHLINGNRQQ
jgi:hypothetical protein